MAFEIFDDLLAAGNVDAFRTWCSMMIDPAEIGNWDKFQTSIIAPANHDYPSGIPAGHYIWQFPEHWFVRGSAARRLIDFSRLERHIGTASGQRLLISVKQYTGACMTVAARRLSFSSVKKRSLAATRLALATLDLGQGNIGFRDLDVPQALRVVAASRTNFDDDALLRCVIQELNDYGQAGLVSDYFEKVDWRQCALDLPADQRACFVGVRQRPESNPRRPLTDAYVEHAMQIIMVYVALLADKILEHARHYAEVRETVLREKTPERSKKLALRRAWRKYSRFAEADAPNWPLGSLPFRCSYEFPPRRLTDLFALISTLQMCAFQLVALDGAMRLSEQHTVDPETSYLLDVSGHAVPILRGRTFKIKGDHGWNGREWAVSPLARRALKIQSELAAAFRHDAVEATVWISTKPDSLGAPMRSAEIMHLNKFAERHYLLGFCENGRICHGQFRKTFARLMALYAEKGIQTVRQQLQHESEDQTSDYILSNPDTGFDLMHDTIKATALTDDQLKEIFQ